MQVEAWDTGWSAPVVLDVESGTLTYDETTYPYAQAEMTLRVPPEQDVLNLLDPRRGVQIRVTLGYRAPGAGAETHRVAALVLWSRTVDRPANRVQLVARSAESKVLTWMPVGSESKTFTADDDAGPAIAELIRWAIPGAVVRNDLPRGQQFVTGADTLVVGIGDSVMSAAYDIANRAGDAWVYEDGLGTWVLRERPALAGQAAAVLKVGPGGSITSSSAVLSLEDFANVVVVEYRWYDGEQQTRRGWAQVASGPFSVAAVGRRVYVERREYKGSAAEAQAAARSIVRRTVTRGRALRVESAAAAYWLRPGHTVTVALPSGPQERHLVQAVQFDLAGSGVMNVTTRLPETFTIETGA
ncbi:hypothetical protein GCM10023113_27550 [Cellulomonas oligotrophica]|uniref:Phage tail protein n=1 Tax=Cellulomonas oligotrophica TaxID=931536 RepID=A0ABQ4DBB3_9CELL|nr:hypothetical protein Col01nite_21820 [Cellulomonas oligotrophica]